MKLETKKKESSAPGPIPVLLGPLILKAAQPISYDRTLYYQEHGRASDGGPDPPVSTSPNRPRLTWRSPSTARQQPCRFSRHAIAFFSGSWALRWEAYISVRLHPPLTTRKQGIPPSSPLPGAVSLLAPVRRLSTALSLALELASARALTAWRGLRCRSCPWSLSVGSLGPAPLSQPRVRRSRANDVVRASSPTSSRRG
jgi:hypothetical protein